MASKPFPPIRVADGARLITSLSLENVGERNWSRKLNMRRINSDQEGRLEGWIKFIGSTQYVFDAAESVNQLAEVVRPNGDRVIVGTARQLIKKYNTGTALWSDIRGGLTFSASGKRWQTDTINGYLAMNNAVDLPVSFRSEDAAVTPIYEMRQIGYARVGRICEYNSFQMVADITRIKADQLDAWMNGYTPHTTTSTVAKAASWAIVGVADHRKLFNVTTGASAITVTLPSLAFSNQPLFFWLAKVDAGAGTVITSPTITDELVVLSAINDSALVWWNGKRWVAKYFAGGVVPATDPYGTPPTSITERYPWAVANSEFGEPTKWAPSFSALMAAASTTVILPFVPSTWVAGTTRVGVIKGGPDGDILGGQTGYEDGILVTAIGAYDPAINGVAITLETTTNASLTYPRVVNVTRWTDISTIVAEYRLVGDSSGIFGMLPLGDQLMLYRDTCIWVGRYTGNATNPFVFVPRVPSKKQSVNLPIWGDAIADVNGDYHLFPGIGNRFYKFDGISWPEVHDVCDQASELFFTGIQLSDECFVVANPYNKAFWFCRPTLTFAYDFEFNSVGEIDAVFGAGAFVMKPGSTDMWFIIAIGRFIYTFGLVTNAATNIKTYLRDSVVPTAILKSGLISGGDFSGEKDLMSYVPVLSSASPDVAVEVQLFSTYNPSVTPVALLSPVEELPTPAGENFFTCAFRAMFFQDMITLVDERDLDFRISQRIFELEPVGRGQGIPRRVTS